MFNKVQQPTISLPLSLTCDWTLSRPFELQTSCFFAPSKSSKNFQGVSTKSLCNFSSFSYQHSWTLSWFPNSSRVTKFLKHPLEIKSSLHLLGSFSVDSLHHPPHPESLVHSLSRTIQDYSEASTLYWSYFLSISSLSPIQGLSSSLYTALSASSPTHALLCPACTWPRTGWSHLFV